MTSHFLRFLTFAFFLFCQLSELQAESLEVVAKLPKETPPGNVAVTPDGRIIMSLHPFYNPTYRVVEVLQDGTTKPFPNESWAKAPQEGSEMGLNAVLGLRSDIDGVVWMLDRSPEAGYPGRLIAWDSRADSLHRVIHLGRPLLGENPFLNDLAIDSSNKFAYIVDMAVAGESALIVLDLQSGLGRRVLQGHPSTKPEDVEITIDGLVIKKDDAPRRIGLNPITIDTKFEWLYFGAMSGKSLYKIQTKYLRDFSLSEKDLAEKVLRVGDKPISDGITMDGSGNVYVTDIENNAIGVVGPSGKYTVLHVDPKLLSFPDGMSFSKNSYVYVTVNQLHRSAVLHGTDVSTPPFYLIRFRALSPGKVGR